MCTYAQSSHVSKATFACSRYLERLIATFQTISAHLRLMLFSFKSPRNRPSPNAHVSAPPLSLLVSHSHPRTDIMGLAASERDGTQASLVGVLLLFGLSLGVVFTCRTIHTISASHKRAHTLSRTELSHEDRNRLADGLAAGRRIVLRGTYKQRRGTSGEPKSHDPSRSLTHSLCTHPSPSNRSHRARASAPCLALQRL